MSEMKVGIFSKKDYTETGKLRKKFKISDDDPDICIAFGGDGTFLKAARYGKPILPVRTDEMGSLGFYADVSLSDIDFIIESLESGRYEQKPICSKLEIKYKGESYDAVNDAVMRTEKESVCFDIYEVVDGREEPFCPYRICGDGLAIATQIGSTAYNLAAGGPILRNPDDICISFLNCGGPFSKNPIVVHKGSEFHVVVAKGSAVLKYDNVEIGLLGNGNGNKICYGSILDDENGFYVKSSEKYTTVIKFPGRTEKFTDKLKRLAIHQMYEIS